jgi:hypothetical protein
MPKDCIQQSIILIFDSVNLNFSMSLTAIKAAASLIIVNVGEYRKQR